jgi:hypothetical protein
MVNALAYTYDAADNLTTLPSGTTLSYDVANELRHESSVFGTSTILS